jgi:hypothetical protein
MLYEIYVIYYQLINSIIYSLYFNGDLFDPMDMKLADLFALLRSRSSSRCRGPFLGVRNTLVLGDFDMGRPKTWI